MIVVLTDIDQGCHELHEHLRRCENPHLFCLDFLQAYSDLYHTSCYTALLEGLLGTHGNVLLLIGSPYYF